VRLFRHASGSTRRAQKRTGRAVGVAARSEFNIVICYLLLIRNPVIRVSTDSTASVDRPAYRPEAPPSGMSDSDGSVDLGPTVGALVVTFLLVTPIAGTVLGFNWTQAVLLGGFASSIAVASAWLTARRGAGDN